MNTYMNQFLIFRQRFNELCWHAYLSSVVRKMTAYPGCAGLARSPFVLTEHISSKIYIYKYGGTYVIIAAHATHTQCGRS